MVCPFGLLPHDEALIKQRKATVRGGDHMNTNSLLFLWLDRNNPATEASPPLEAGRFGLAAAGRAMTDSTRVRRQAILEALEKAYGGDPTACGGSPANVNPWPAFDTFSWTGNGDCGGAGRHVRAKGQGFCRLNVTAERRI